MQSLEFTTTAMRRPGVFMRTLQSFTTNLRGIDWQSSTLYLNIDPLPLGGSSCDVGEVANRFFGRVITRMPPEPSFPAAVKWCWSQPEGEFFFHLEDDWELIEPFDIQNALAWFESPWSCVNLRAYMHNPNPDPICLSPGVLRTADAKVMAAAMTLTANPERQLRAVSFANLEGGKQGDFKGIAIPADRPVIVDIGRTWLANSGYEKEQGAIFTKWQRA